MLISTDNGKTVTRLPHKREFDYWRARISDEDYAAAVDAINAYVDQREIFNASWIPGSDWRETAYQPIYVACGENETQAGLFFGLIVFETLMNRQDKRWGFDRCEINGKDPGGMTYYELNNR